MSILPLYFFLELLTEVHLVIYHLPSNAPSSSSCCKYTPKLFHYLISYSTLTPFLSTSSHHEPPKEKSVHASHQPCTCAYHGRGGSAYQIYSLGNKVHCLGPFRSIQQPLIIFLLMSSATIPPLCLLTHNSTQLRSSKLSSMTLLRFLPPLLLLCTMNPKQCSPI